jgi:hypothetical protein
MIYAMTETAVVLAAVIWVLLPNPGFTPGIDHRGRTHHPFFTVRLSADGIPMVCHDAMVDRTTNGTGRIGDLAASRLKELDGAFWWPHQDEPDRHCLSDPDFPWRGRGLRIITLGCCSMRFGPCG